MASFESRWGQMSREPPQVYPKFPRSPNIEDRREQELTPLEQAQILMGLVQGQNPKYPAAGIVQPLAGPLSVEAGMLDIVPSHERWLAQRIGATPSAITVSNR